MIADLEGPSFISCTVERRRYSDDASVTHDPIRKSFAKRSLFLLLLQMLAQECDDLSLETFVERRAIEARRVSANPGKLLRLGCRARRQERKVYRACYETILRGRGQPTIDANSAASGTNEEPSFGSELHAWIGALTPLRLSAGKNMPGPGSTMTAALILGS